VRALTVAVEVIVLSALVLATRCANYQDVFVRGNVYFSDADCYARMTRARVCLEHPGTIVRHHEFENFPEGTTPHTTAPLDYLIVVLSILLKPLTSQPLDLAGAIVSPLVALLGAWFLWWWSRRMKVRYRWAMLILYAISPILVHGTALGRPDHQSLLMLLVTVGICAEWSLRFEQSRNWSIISGIAWGVALWVSLYEPLIVFALVLLTGLTRDKPSVLGEHRRIGWIVFALIVVTAALIERRLPDVWMFETNPAFASWSRTIGELAHISAANPIWFAWSGYLIAIVPILIWYAFRKRSRLPIFVVVLLVAMFALTIWEARWSYFFLSMFVLALPGLLAPVESRVAVWVAFGLSILPILQWWDARLWPNESVLAVQIEHRREAQQLRDLALTLRSPQVHPFVAPWWLSPSIAYWSGQPGVAGSSHEALPGIVDTARFYLETDFSIASEILRKRRADWVLSYDSERVIANSAALLAVPVPERPLCRILDQTPSKSASFLLLSGQNDTAKLFRFTNKL
jgi:MFS family permease